MRIYLTDHNNPLLIGNIRYEDILNNLSTNVKIVDDREQADRIIAHYGFETLNSLDSSTALEAFPDFQVCFCVTTEEINGTIGYPENQRKHRKHISGNKTRYVLYGRRLNQLHDIENEEQPFLHAVLDAFIKITPEQADAIVNRDFDNMPKILANIFHVTTFDIISSLSILCQGYLAVHSNSSLYQDLSQSNLLPKDTHRKSTKTEEPRWWQEPFLNLMLTREQLNQHLLTEWKPKVFPETVQYLLDAMYGHNRVELKIVEEAYKHILCRLADS